MITTKVCSVCGIEKELSYFGIKKNTKDGFRYDCKECRKIESFKYRNSHQEQIKIHRDVTKEQQKQYRIIHRDMINEKKREYHFFVERNYCISGKEAEIENYFLAKTENFIGWDRHHRLETHNSDGEKRLVQLSQKELVALDMYYNRPPEELIWLKRKDHSKIHKCKVV